MILVLRTMVSVLRTMTIIVWTISLLIQGCHTYYDWIYLVAVNRPGSGLLYILHQVPYTFYFRFP